MEMMSEADDRFLHPEEYEAADAMPGDKCAWWLAKLPAPQPGWLIAHGFKMEVAAKAMGYHPNAHITGRMVGKIVKHGPFSSDDEARQFGIQASLI